MILGIMKKEELDIQVSVNVCVVNLPVTLCLAVSL